ncbi:MAG: class II glutamine amidotransferase [Burkholderiales bacterium]
MCELFGSSSNRPVELASSLKLFGKRGGETAENPDGWGLAHRESGRFVLQKEPDAAAGSPLFAQLAETVRSNLVIAHVRKANPPTGRTMANTHPFIRDCCGRPWVFAHNGKVPEAVQPDGCCHPRLSRPLGETDSEHAFCFLLDEIASVFHSAASIGRMNWLQTLATLSGTIAAYGRFNFLLSDGEHLIAYGHDRLHRVQRRCKDIKITLLASEPLTDNERWEAFRPGELQVFRQGERVACWQSGTTQAGTPHTAECI